MGFPALGGAKVLRTRDPGAAVLGEGRRDIAGQIGDIGV